MVAWFVPVCGEAAHYFTFSRLYRALLTAQEEWEIYETFHFIVG